MVARTSVSMGSGAEEERVEDVMAKRVVTIGFEATVRDGASLMARRKCRRAFLLKGARTSGFAWTAEEVGRTAEGP